MKRLTYWMIWMLGFSALFAIVRMHPVVGATMREAGDRQFLQTILDEGDQVHGDLSWEEYLLRHIHVRHGSTRIKFNFDGHAAQQALVRKYSKHPDLSIMKAAQVIASTLSITRAAWVTNGNSYKVIWFFPDDGAMRDFVQDRVTEIIDDSDLLTRIQDTSTGADNVRLKKLGLATWIFRSTYKVKGAKTADADFIILDEFDEQNQENIQFTDDRTLHSPLRWKMALSQPSIEETGIHAAYLDGTMDTWLIKCRCRHWTDLVQRFQDDPLSIFGTGSKGEIYFACEKCGSKLNTQKGELVSRFPERSRASVQLSQLFTQTAVTPAQHKEMVEKALRSLRLRKNYWISKVGIPCSGADEKPITQELLDSIRGDHGVNHGSPYYTYMGADQGDTVHMLFAEPTDDGRYRIVGLEKFPSLDREYAPRTIVRWCLFRGVVDALPNKVWSKGLALEFPGIISIQYFAKKFRMSEEAVPGDDEGIDVITTNRDESLDETVIWIKQGRFILPDKSRLSDGDLALVEELELHLRMLIKERHEDDNGDPIYSYKKKVPNHYGMALNSLRLAIETSGAPGADGVIIA